MKSFILNSTLELTNIDFDIVSYYRAPEEGDDDHDEEDESEEEYEEVDRSRSPGVSVYYSLFRFVADTTRHW